VSGRTPASVGRWRIEWRTETAGDVHAAEPGDASRPQIWVVEVTRPALVLGSAQGRGRAEIDARVERLGFDVDVVVRRSGGGAVYLAPGDQVWIDVFVPTHDDRWDADIGRAVEWLGAVWSETVGTVVAPALRPEILAHEGAVLNSSLSAAVCFAGVGPGEVTVAGRKATGISQRRTRRYCRFQCTALLAWTPIKWIDTLVDADERDAALAVLERVAGPVGADSAAVVAAFLRAIATR
jgi:lipoate-protein ligase A